MSQLTHPGRILQRPLGHIGRNVVAYLALFVALGGTSAVALGGSNTVFSDDIANDNFNSPTEGQGGLVASDLRAGSVGSAEVANGTLKAEDYGIGSVSGARIQDNNVTSLDLADGAVFGNDIRDGSLNDEDVGQVAFVDFGVDVGTIAAGVCTHFSLGAAAQQGDHMLLTPWDDSTAFFDYSVHYDSSSNVVLLRVCNRHSSALNDGNTTFSLLVFDAQ